MPAFDGKLPREALAAVAGFAVEELELSSFAGEPVYLLSYSRQDGVRRQRYSAEVAAPPNLFPAASDGGRASRVIPVAGSAMDAFDPQRIIGIVTKAAGLAGSDVAEIRVMDEYDAYYLDRTGRRPLPVVYARLNDADSTRYYIDPKTGRVAGSYSSRGWVNRWLYHGLHSMDFPWLYKYRPLWDIVVIAFMAGGTALCVTSLILAWRVLGGYFFAGGVQRAGLSAGPVSR